MLYIAWHPNTILEEANFSVERSTITVFYSWQSDHPNVTNRGFIERALEGAVKTIRNDNSIHVEPVLDRDTAGVPGSPEISGTIFSKISQAQVFVCDVSIINQQQEGRPTPNPNVLVELGYALNALGFEHIIMVLNDAFGGPELLPFDLRMRRITRYTMPNELTERAPERKRLEALLTNQLRTIVAQLEIAGPEAPVSEPTIVEQTIEAVENERANQVVLVRRYMDSIIADIKTLTPTFANDGAEQWDDQLVQAIEQSLDLVVGFARVTAAISLMTAKEAAHAIYSRFAGILDLYVLPPHFHGQFHDFDFDLAKFLGHELFVIFISALIREDRWDLVAGLLDEDLLARGENFVAPSLLPFTAISDFVQLLEMRKGRLASNRMSLHADLLKERHSSGELGQLIPIEHFAEADYFLFLRAQLSPTEAPKWIEWKAWGALNLNQVPRYLRLAEREKYAQALLPALDVSDVETLKDRMSTRAGQLNGLWPKGFWSGPVRTGDVQKLGTR
jgi:hypothetical protein